MKVSAFVILVNFSGILCVLDEILDLTWNFSNETVYWPGVRPFIYTKVVGNDVDRGYWYAVNEFCAAEHGGTHFDAPYHFNKDGWKVAEVPITRLIARGASIDLSKLETKILLPQHLVQWENSNGPFLNNTVLLVRFGWSENWSNRTKYLGVGDDDKLNFPGISPAAAEWIANSRKIVGVGIDTSSIDPGNSTNFTAHRILSKNQIYGLENVKLLTKLPEKGFTLLVLPMKLEEGTGAPLRIFAIPEIK